MYIYTGFLLMGGMGGRVPPPTSQKFANSSSPTKSPVVDSSHPKKIFSPTALSNNFQVINQ